MKQYILLDGVVRKIKDGASRDEVIRSLKAKGHQVEKVNNPPSIGTMTKWVGDGVAKATDGCRVEPDGSCVHGHRSWLLVLNYI